MIGIIIACFVLASSKVASLELDFSLIINSDSFSNIFKSLHFCRNIGQISNCEIKSKSQAYLPLQIINSIVLIVPDASKSFFRSGVPLVAFFFEPFLRQQ